jgi:phage terminase small subunit
MSKNRLNPIKKLLPKHKIFISEYIIDSNASRAAQIAGYTKKSAGIMAGYLLKDDLIQQEIRRLQAKSIAMVGITSQYILETLKDIAETYKLKSPQSALRALELLGKHLGMWNADNADRNRRPHELTDKELIALGMELAKGKGPKAIEATIT